MPGQGGETGSGRSKIRLEEHEGWTKISMRPCSNTVSPLLGELKKPAWPEAPEPMQDRIVRISEDLHEITKFYNIEGSPTRYARLSEFFGTELAALSEAAFSSYSQDEKVDYILLKNFLYRSQRNLKLDREREAAFAPFVEPFAEPIWKWCAIRQRQRLEEVFEPQTLADSLSQATDAVSRSIAHVEEHRKHYSQATGSRAARRICELRKHIDETCDFYSGYHPSFDYWVASPRAALDAALKKLEKQVRDVIIGSNGGEDTIVGEPIGRDGLLVELEAEMIPYSPEELLKIAEREYVCSATRIGATGLEYVKNLYEPPATHTAFVRGLVAEGASYVKKHDLVTVPRLAEETITITRIPPVRQRVSPFFLGGHRLQIAYPRADMAHGDKLMTLRGNNRHFSKATAFHEMIPGHRLQMYIGDRSRPYRAKLFSTPFFVEGWALYWEMVFWDRGDFFTSPEDRIGTLFWRMHRCIRIIFSLGFHLGRISAAECVELLVQRVGHERSTAEGEVRRSLNGSYPPLYQAGYMLGALQMMQLRREALGARRFAEKEFHDRVLKANVMPVEMLRALLLEKELHEDFKANWRFYGHV
ncbi:hypothetical protein F5B22DRAFT_640074 [Xylaria bambusicola]|uniref:uncharacterized protein n=1 Tax=Xylaria bambusicola TaxID=326684 RepID=UPI0020078502|nr:uncharacterized protein F5B22DRAFT_640074 [Xylaria bambusicola]KAI0505214.1 hypothetical protein F5B22DRAFT_640074 [Xylaria bambusicola]